MEEILVAGGLATVVKAIVDLIKSPIKQRYPEYDLWWFVYVGVLVGVLVGWFSGVNIFADWVQDLITGRILTGVLIGGGSSLIHDIFKPKVAAATPFAGAINIAATPPPPDQGGQSRIALAAIAGVVLLALVVVWLIVRPVEQPTARGGELAVTGGQCVGDEIQVRVGTEGRPQAVCYDDETPTPEPTYTPTPTLTPLPPTHTDVPGLTPTLEPSPTAAATFTATPVVTATPVAEAGKECPTWVHDGHVAAGPDGKFYPTWHPDIDPDYGCYFGHTHGDDPRVSSVAQTMPAFGYVGAVAGMAEPHAGFKVFNFECGEPGDQGPSRIASRFVMHMGTSGVARYMMAFHSIEYDARACDGSWEVHLKGMGNFGDGIPVGSICDNPRQGGRDFSTIGCVEAGKPENAYEIWGGHFSVRYPDEFDELFQSRAYVQLVPALFDPVTTLDPTDMHQVVYTADIVYPGQFDPLSQQSPFRGCRMETYQGPLSINNRNSPVKYITDVYGVIQEDAIEGDPGTLVQYVSAVRVDGAAANASQNGTQFKKEFDFCSPFLHAPN